MARAQSYKCFLDCPIFNAFNLGELSSKPPFGRMVGHLSIAGLVEQRGNVAAVKRVRRLTSSTGNNTLPPRRDRAALRMPMKILFSVVLILVVASVATETVTESAVSRKRALT